MYGQRTPLWMVVGAVLATVTVVRSTCSDAAAVYPGNRVWRPCREAVQRRRYEEIAPTVDADDGSDEEQRYWDGGAEDDGADDDSADNVYVRPPPYVTMDDKLKRGVRVVPPTQNRPFEKKLNRPLSATAAAGPGNTLRMDPSLLRGETVELPTYVNVPVTLRCKFVPVDGTDNKFETVVEAMFPGHADGPPPSDDSPASRILKQLAGSVDGWRGVVNKSARPVRRVIENRFGRWVAWPPADVDWTAPPAAKPLRYDGNGRQIFVRLRAAERAQRYHGTGRQQYHGGSWNGVEDQPEVVKQVVDDQPNEPQQSDDGPIVERLAENQLIDDDQLLADRLDDRPIHRIDDRLIVERMQRLQGARQQDHRGWYTGKRPDIGEKVVRERVDDLHSEQVAERFNSIRQQNQRGWYPERRPEVVEQEVVQEQIDDQPSDQVDDQLSEQVDDRVSGQADDQPIEHIDDQIHEQVDDRPSEHVNDRQVTERVHGVRQQKHHGWYTERRPEVVVQEQVDNQLSEQVDDRLTARLRAAERVQRLHGGRQQDHRGRHAEDQPEVVGPGRVVDGRDADDLDYRQAVQDGEQADMLDSTMPEITTTAKWDYATLGRGIPVRTYMEQGFSTPSDQYDGSESL